jgi:predicted metal-dependent phosphoesterase TrpH
VDRSAAQVRLDFHCHSVFSFDGAVDPLRLLELAQLAGLTHLAITDHDTIEGALVAQRAANSPVTVIVGQEMNTTEGDMIGLYLQHPIPSDLSPEETAARVHGQGGLVGLPHPFDVRRLSIGRGTGRPADLGRLAGLADYVEVYNARVRDNTANARAADFAREHGLPGVAASDSHTEPEVGATATILDGPIDGAEDLRLALGRGSSLYVRSPDEISGSRVAQLMARLRGG